MHDDKENHRENNEIKFWKIYIFVVSYLHQIPERVQKQANMSRQWLHIVH